ncbi:MAG: sulfatase-like hydrolase/transferase [Planctomyces sp.]|nr:sulfatase-like hydrolase/transferase [Planctomyces sp.]
MLRTLLTALLGMAAVAGRLGAADVRPNVIVILTDDQGSVDAGCYGSADIQTPHLDALAARGVRFTQFYAGAPVCSPSRAALLTGRYPLRAGVPTNCASQPGAPGALPPEQVTMAEVFHAAGYATAHIGKWHLGYTPETMPLAQGFDHSFGHMGGCIDNWSHFFFWSGPNIHDLHRNGREAFHDGRYFPDLMVEEAAAFLDQHRDGPFLMYFAMNMPHYPYQGDQHWLERYADLPHPRRLYAAFVSTLDERVGRLLAHVDSLGLRGRTIVVYQSDNGHSTEDRAHHGGGSSGPYRGAKFSLFEGGIRLPAVISWPGRIPEGETREQPAHACDWLPTLVELTGVEPRHPELDGRSLVEVLQSSAAPSPHAVLHWQVGTGPGAQWAVREGDWKLIGNAADTGETPSGARIPLFLSNLDEDVSESTNHADAQPDVVERLQRLHDDWLRDSQPE